ncbi:MAG TPA: alpha/beta hydrolase [Acidobacteriaceae bacterium]|nr:alpha/beta hydrolase [Acidobacteriaceae bacterium]
MRWLITNRNQQDDGFGKDYAQVTLWKFDPASGKDITKRSSWQPLTLDQFKAALIEIAKTFPNPIQLPSADQKHLSLFIHGYNNGWIDAVTRYDKIAKTLYDGPDSLGEIISFDWPSKGELLGYLPDRAEARKVADDLTNVLSELYDWMSAQQLIAQQDPTKACRARTSIIAHSMGNYVLEYSMNDLWTRKNRPLLVSLMNEVLMVAADVDNDLFRSGETVTHGDGEGLANLSYRITALYTGRDDVLGASAGLKHFGKRRLGRAGLDNSYPVPDNVWDVDCTQLFLQPVNGIQIHGEYFEPAETKIYELMDLLLKGKDRSILIGDGLIPSALPRVQPTG